MRSRRGHVRVAGYFFFLALVASLLSIRSARAQAGEQALTLGRELHRLTGAGHAETTRVLVDGEAMLVGSAISEDSASVVLDRFEAHCRERPYLEAAALRSGTDDGVVVCFTRSEGVSELRFAYARPASNGRTHVLTVWAEEGFDVRRLIFEEGKDVGGEDLAEAPRPPASDRLLAARIDHQPYGVNVYVSRSTPAEVVAFYEETLGKAGWRSIDPHLEGDAESRSYERDGLVITVHASREEGRTFVGLGLAGATAPAGEGR